MLGEMWLDSLCHVVRKWLNFCHVGKKILSKIPWEAQKNTSFTTRRKAHSFNGCLSHPDIGLLFVIPLKESLSGRWVTKAKSAIVNDSTRSKNYGNGIKCLEKKPETTTTSFSLSVTKHAKLVFFCFLVFLYFVIFPPHGKTGENKRKREK